MKNPEKKNKRLSVAVIYLVVVLTAFITSFATRINPVYSASDKQISAIGKKCSFPIAAVGDLQRTSLWEYMIGRESNDVERKEIIGSISGQNPGSVILLGDMVFEGDNIDHWKYFDTLMIPLEEKNIAIFPVIGNHEYYGKNRIALKYLTNRFPVLKRKHWYTEICDSIALIFLDSNESEYSDKEWNGQIEWFKNKLSDFDNKSSIKGILVFEHHPPYTNSLITGDEMTVQRAFVPAFDKSRKTLAFISGHAHTYERFIENGKTFIISGGGGGPRVLLKTGPDKHYDYYNGPSPRPFNYLLINKKDNGISFTVKGVNKGSSRFFTLEKFTIPFNK
jgi:Icc-related predicted phosphoesterase